METFSDIFKKSFMEGSTTQISIPGIFLVLGLSLVVAGYIYIVYKKCYIGVIYSHNFNVALAMMTIISAMIIATISSNITLSLGMVGALSIVRFRTAIKDPIDLIFLFWAVAAGITVGARLWVMVLLGNLCIGLAFMFMTKLKRKDVIYLLVISYDDEAFPAVNAVLQMFKSVLRSKISRNGLTEMTVEINMSDENTQFTEKLTAIPQVHSVSLVTYSGEFAQ
ncbi:DUF4956 domain-containing protein [Fundicoccus sp. Sow4_F4]|uniref:DUF4956 domain-containing protein n=1 Tax=Fundicoccus sp. Sow4_F4 TaxID=3438783 RepID=UPI003F8E68D2